MHLTKILTAHLDWNKARISLLANLIIALLKVKTVCLTEIVTALPGKAKTESKYKQLQRFFRLFEMDISAGVQHKKVAKVLFEKAELKRDSNVICRS